MSEAYDASDAEQVEDAQTKQRILDNEEGEVLRTLMHSQAGRRWLARHLLGPGRLFTPVVNAAYDPVAVAYQDGARSLALTIQNDLLRHGRDLYMVVLQEHLH